MPSPLCVIAVFVAMSFLSGVSQTPASPAFQLGVMMVEVTQSSETGRAGIQADDILNLYNAGLLSYKHGELDKAENYYSQALALAEKLVPDGLLVAKNLDGLGDIASHHSNLAKAERLYRRALGIQENLAANGLDVAQSLQGLGNVAVDRGDLSLGQKYFLRCLSIRGGISPGSLEVASVLNDLGYLALESGDLEKAEQYHGQAFTIQEKLAPKSLDLAKSLNGLATVARGHGDLALAESYYRQALAIREKLAPESLDVAGSLHNLGLIFKDRHDFAKAEEYQHRDLAITQRLVPGSLRVAISLHSLAAISEARADLSKAEMYHRQALEIRERLAPGSLDVARSLMGLGFVALLQHDLMNAETYFQQGLAIYRKLAPGSPEIASYLNNLGVVARERGNLAQAEEYELQALALREKLVPGSWLVAWSLNSLGDVARDRGDLTAAEVWYHRALALRQRLVPSSQDYAETLAALALVMRKKHQLDDAAQFYEQALNALESQTSRLGGSADVRSSFRAKYADYYRDYIDLLLEQKKPELAFQVLERSRARALLELMSQAHVDIRQGVDTALLTRESSLQESMRVKSNLRLRLLNGTNAQTQLATLDQEIKMLLGEYGELEAQIRQSSPGYAALTQPQPLSAAEIRQQVLDRDSLLLEYSLGTDRSYLFMLSSTTLQSYELPKRADIENTARQVYTLLTAPNHPVKGESQPRKQARLRRAVSEFSKAAAELSRMLLGPAASELGTKRLLIVSDGALAYIPFAALPMPATNASSQQPPLIAEHEIVNLPSASVMPVLRQQEKKRKLPDKAIAVLADPVFSLDDPRVGRHQSVFSQADQSKDLPLAQSPDLLIRPASDIGLERDGNLHLDRLRFTRQEAEAIATLTPAGQGMQALDFHANRETVMSGDLAQYRIVHFATHGLLDSRHPELSGLVLSLVDEHGVRQNGFLELQDIYNLNLSADLVVLSACETGLGKEIDGEGLVGLSRGFMYAGADRVMASLWNVSDVATADLMGHFYRAMERAGMRPSAALRAAQVKMWKQRRWKNPYYWAAFQIQGEWN